MRFFLWNNPFNFELSMIEPGNHGPKSRSARTSEICENAGRGAPWIPRLSLQKNQTNTVYLKWGASSRWSFGPKSACGSIETMTIGKTHSTLAASTLNITNSKWLVFSFGNTNVVLMSNSPEMDYLSVRFYLIFCKFNVPRSFLVLKTSVHIKKCVG